MPYKYTKVMFRSPNGNGDFFDIVPAVLWENTAVIFLLIICPGYKLWTSTELIKKMISL